MTRFFIRLKGWQLGALEMAAFFIPLAIFIFRAMALAGPDRKIDGAALTTLFCQLCGFLTVLHVGILFSWQWTTSRYLNSLLPGNDQENSDYSLYTRSLFLSLLWGIAGAVLFFTRYILVLFFFARNHLWVFFVFIILVFAMIFLARRTFVFTYKASTSLLTGTPYKNVKANYFSSIPQASLQNRIREVYLKYGDHQ